MTDRILVAVAWPYANGSIHLGQVAGAYLPADIFARYHRLKGNEVLMVSGSDAHGTPVTLTAEARGVNTSLNLLITGKGWVSISIFLQPHTQRTTSQSLKIYS